MVTAKNEVIKGKSLTKRVNHIAWKKAFCEDGNEVIIKLQVEEDTLSIAKGNYLVSKKVVALAIFDMWGWKTGLTETKSNHNRNFIYKVGETYSPANGIWCWPTFEEARQYWLNQCYEGKFNPDYEQFRRKN